MSSSAHGPGGRDSTAYARAERAYAYALLSSVGRQISRCRAVLGPCETSNFPRRVPTLSASNARQGRTWDCPMKGVTDLA